MATVEFRRNGNQRQVRVTREAADAWCFDRLRDQARSVLVRTTSSTGGSLTTRSASASYDAINEQITYSYTTTDNFIFDLIVDSLNTRTFFEVDWNRRVLIGEGSFDGQWLDASPTIRHHASAICDPIADILINGTGGAITLTAGDTIVLTWTSQYATSATVTIGSTVTDVALQGADNLTSLYLNQRTQVSLNFLLTVTGLNGSIATDGVILTVNPVDITTDSGWASLVRMTPFVEPSTDSDWSSLARITAFEEPSTDSDWSSLQRMAGFLEPGTDSDWSTLVQMTPPATVNRPPVWDPPAAFNVNVNDDATINLDNFCSDPDVDSLTYTASESSTFYSESVSGSILTLDGGSSHRIDAGDITLTANDGRGGTASVDVQVNVIDTSINTPPVIVTPLNDPPRVIVDGSGANRVMAGSQFRATDADGDTIPTWDAAPPNRWRLEGSSALSTTIVPGEEQTGEVRLSAVQDYFATDRGQDITIYSSQIDPQYMDLDIGYRVRCQDNRGAWSAYVNHSVNIVQAVHGSRANVNVVHDYPDRRQPNIWAFHKDRTDTMRVGGALYQYVTPDDARADKANWKGTLRYPARFLYRDPQGGSPPLSSVLLTRGIRNVHPSLNAAKVPNSDNIDFAPKTDALNGDAGEYTSAFQWTTLCEVEVDVGEFFTGFTYAWIPITGFIFVTGDDETTDSDWSTLVQMTPEPSTDSDWSSLVNFPREASTDSDWSSLERMTLNSPPVCATLPDRTVVNGQSLSVDLSSFLSDPDGDSITIEVSESDADISISNLNASGHSFTINGLSVGTATVTVTPIDERGLRGTACTFTVTVEQPVSFECTSRDITLSLGSFSDVEFGWSQGAFNLLHDADALDQDSMTRFEIQYSGSVIRYEIEDLHDDILTIYPLAEGTASIRYRIRSTPPDSITTRYCTILVTVLDPTRDGSWSNLLSSPTTDGGWSNLHISPTVDGPWSNLVESITRDGAWSNLLASPSRDGAWSNLEASPSVNSAWSPVIGTVVCDGEWSGIVVLTTQDGEWSNLLALDTADGVWSNLVISPTVASEWSPIIGTVVCDGEWSMLALLDLPQDTTDGEWSELAISPTVSSPWGNLLSPSTQNGAWSDLLSPLFDDSLWSVVSNVAYRPRHGTLAQIVAHSTWGAVSAPAYRPRHGPLAITPYHSEWSALSNAAYRPRPSPLAQAVYHSAWSVVSAPAYRPRHGPLQLIVANSAWGELSNVAHRPRRSPLKLVWHTPWSDLSNTAYRPRAGPLAQIVYHSEWSDVSNVAKQERIVLTAIGGAFPFLHIYEARRGHVLVRRLVEHTTGDLFGGAGFERAAINTDRDDDRAIIDPKVTLGHLRDGEVAIDVYRTTDTDIPATPSAFRFYLANTEGTDPSFVEVYYDVTPSNLLLGQMPFRIRITADADSINFQRYDSAGNEDGTSHDFSFGTETIGDHLRVVVIAVTPQHDNNRLSYIAYRNQRINDWHYYHGVPEIYVSDRLDIVADEEAFSYNGRDSANFQSPPHVGYASALVRQHQRTPNSWFEELLNRDHVVTGQRVHVLLEDEDGNFGKDFTGILQTPPLQHRDNIYDWRVQIQDPTTLMVQSFANSTILKGPADGVTVGSGIRDVAREYSNRVAGLELDDVLDPLFEPDNFPVRLAWFWTDYESERNILQRLVNTMGPPASFYVNNLGQLVFTSCESRGTPIQIGGDGSDAIPISQVVSFSDHVVDVSNDARIPVSLHGWILPENLNSGESVSHVYENPEDWDSQTQRDRVAIQLFENYQDNAMYNLAHGSGMGVTFGADGTYRYRIRTNGPVAPANGMDSFTLAPSSLTEGTDYTIDHIAANVIDVTMMGTAGAGVPSFQLLGARLQNFRTIEAWTGEDVTEENETRFSRYLYHYREFQYGGYTSIALTDAQVLADWVVQYYRKGIKTMTLELFCSNNVQEALRLEPDRTPVRVAHGYGDGAPEQWIVRSRKRIYKDGHMWVEVTLDEDVMHSLGLDHAPFCTLYAEPDREQVDTARLNVDAVGVLLYEDSLGVPTDDPLTIPEAGLVSNSPDLAATVLPIANTTNMPDTVKTWPSGADLWQIDSGEALAAHYDFTRLEGLEGHHFWRSGLKANGMSLWLLDKKEAGNYWAMLSLNLRADNPVLDGVVLPAMYHFLRVRYTSLGAAQDVVYSFSTPRTTLADNTNHWLTVAQEQPWLSDDDAGVAHDLNERAIILEWRAYDSATMNTGLGTDDGSAKINVSVVSQEAETTETVAFEFIPNQLNITRSFGVS